jgi:ankyrin repeat protein
MDIFDEIDWNNISYLERYIADGGDIEIKKYNTKETPLIYASRKDKLKIVKLLLDSGANINAKDRDNSTSLIQSIMFENKEIVELLLLNGAKIDNETIETATFYNALGTKTEIIKILTNFIKSI